ncbi:MAG: ACT domain-containing protein [Anaerolineae bacterium]|nr:ACT domain-containing protein [Anaerolineae bacterium]
MNELLDDALKRTTLYTDGALYVFVLMPSGAVTEAASIIAELPDPFTALLIDKDEITFVLPLYAWEQVAARVPGATRAREDYRLITFDAVLPPSLIGYMARISAALAAAGVPIFPFSAYSRDQLLVPASQFDQAWATLIHEVGLREREEAESGD